MMKYINFLLFFLLIFTSCKSKKNIVDEGTGAKNLSARKVARNHIQANFNKKTVDARLKVHFKNEKQNRSISVRMKIKKDEVIWLKGTYLITLFKAKITRKKVSFYSPYQRSYFEGDFSMLKRLLGTEINFEQLQNMLFGQALLNVKSQKQDINFVEKSYQLSPKTQSDLFDIFFQINPQHFKLNKQFLVNSVKNKRLDITYPKYIKEKEVLFPERIIINARDKNKSTLLDIMVRSVTFNQKISMPFKIPLGYKEIKF